MNPVTQVLNVMLNLLIGPFSDPANTIMQYQDNAAKFLASLPTLPVSLLKGMDGTCNTFLFKMGENELKVSILPRGYCTNCCPVRASRDIRFVLYTKTNPAEGAAIEPYDTPGAARRAGVNNTLPTEIFIHGFTEPSPGDSGREIVNAYFSRAEDFNIILLDWSELCSFPWYRPAVQNVKWAAELLKNFLETFHDSGEIPISSVHIIGFSLGSHIASFTGKKLRKDLRIPRITALDPAYPEYSLRDTSRRLTQTDAEYVDVIHTDAGVLGFPIPIGHADFYPNGGRPLQPGCQPSYLVQERLIDQVLACSHVRAWKLYVESVRHDKTFPATKCKNWKGANKRCNFTLETFLGYSNDKKAQGQFYLMTHQQAPFSMRMEEQMKDTS